MGGGGFSMKYPLKIVTVSLGVKNSPPPPARAEPLSFPPWITLELAPKWLRPRSLTPLDSYDVKKLRMIRRTLVYNLTLTK